MSYILNTEAMRVVEKNDKGTVTYRKRYKKGDEVDTSHMDEARVEHLVSKGTLVQSEDDLSEDVDAGSLAPTSGPFGAASAHQDGTTVAAPPAEPVQDGSVEGNTFVPVNDDDESAVTPTEPTGEDDVEEVDKYSEMDYADLQKAAKARDLNAGGSGDEIRARLRADDAS